MGKICDPPPFLGGQSTGINYLVITEATTNDGNKWYCAGGNFSYTLVDFRASGQFRAVIGSISSFDFDASNFRAVTYRINGVQQGGGYLGFPWAYAVSVRIFSIERLDGQPDTGGDPPSTNCRCSDDSCRVDCATAPDGFCCIDNSFTDRLLQSLQ